MLRYFYFAHFIKNVFLTERTSIILPLINTVVIALGLTAGSDYLPDFDSMNIEEWGTTTVWETITNADSTDLTNIGDK